MSSHPLRDWYSPTVIGIAERLLAAPSEAPLTVDELAHPLGRGARGVRDLLDRLYQGQMVSRARAEPSGAGRPPYHYWLSEEQRPAAQRASDTEPALWPSRRQARPTPRHDSAEPVPSPAAAALGPHVGTPAEHDQVDGSGATVTAVIAQAQQLVLVNLRVSTYADVLEVLSSSGASAAAAAAWIAQVGHELAFAFDPAASIVADDLRSLFEGARLDVRVAHVGHVRPTAVMLDQARRMAPEIRRARMTRDARRVWRNSPSPAVTGRS
jgi:hypothetical protein